ncbi:cytochrome c oxidase subunit 7A1, mitochondrial-like [Dromiciops gliroides]|uniref:cytochrome c oxidase subunit 7A1, mitochondrial-like n=1 Tax=Dromiciops gliroides TaxID=33562 RepID=UPI001CC34DCE|nr:cytochrome c oxidase subunit 7A1, mitochondrial-like [Dromiciops gliroides]
MRGLLVSHSRTLIRTFSSSSRNSVNKIAEKQKLFQENNDLPIYLKGKGTDGLLFKFTILTCFVGTCYCFYCLGWASFPHKKED